jgi:hypothetical protein
MVIGPPTWGTTPLQAGQTTTSVTRAAGKDITLSKFNGSATTGILYSLSVNVNRIVTVFQIADLH